MSRPISCIIVDDDETSRFILTNLVKKNESLKLLKACSNAVEARQTIEENEVELMLLDIEMPYENGVDMLAKLEVRPDVIFITSQTKHAIKAFEFDAVDYIVKPVDLSRLNEAVDKAKRRFFSENQTAEFENEDEFVLIKKNRETRKIPYRDIGYIIGSSSYITYCTTDGKITTTGILKQVEETLKPNVFVRVHRSYLVNIKKVTKMTSQEIFVRNSAIPLSRKYKKEVKQIFDEQNKNNQ
ncbi:MAG: LytR/AlgR family response regulator transcription factor [Flavobacteriales bacterium]